MMLKSLEEQIRVVFWSVDANVPARVAVLLARRAVNWKPQANCAGSAMVTTRCCFTPGMEVCPFGKATLTLPLLAGSLVVPTWHPVPDVQVPSSFGTPEWPGFGPYSYAQMRMGRALIITATLAIYSFLLRSISMPI